MSPRKGNAPKRARSKGFVEVGDPSGLGSNTGFWCVTVIVARQRLESESWYHSRRSALRAARAIAADLNLEFRP